MVAETSSPLVHRQSASSALLNVGSKLFTEGKEDDAMSMFDAADQVLSTACDGKRVALCASQLEWGSQQLSESADLIQIRDPVDTYHEDECDVGPRPFCKPLVPLNYMHADLIQITIWYNKALICHSKRDAIQAIRLYQAVITEVTRALASTVQNFMNANDLYHLAMRAYNNIGHIHYLESSEESALFHFQTAVSFAEMIEDSSSSHQIDYASVLSNWCRVQWMMGDVSDALHSALEKVLKIRSDVLGWDHADVAASHYNLGMIQYARQSNEEAQSHLMKYLQVAAHRAKLYSESELDPMPALIYVLLIKNDDKNDKMAQDLVRGLRTLQDKRQDLGPNNSEIASVLNFIGTLLFHQRELDHALLFFQEELRLEELLVATSENISVSVTCNNIGRILQELGRFPEAIYYYQRSLEPEFGRIVNNGIECCKLDMAQSIELFDDRCIDAPQATMNLYSTVWYNLGLIHDKMGAFKDAIKAFQMSLKVRRAMLGPDHADVACLLYNIGVLQMEQQLLAEATESFREALRIRRVATTGQLNDRHVVKTLQKLATLHKSKGNIAGALEACHEVLHILKVSSDFDKVLRNRDMGSTMKEIADLHHAKGDIEKAIEVARESVKLLERCRSEGCNSTAEHFTCVEQETATLLLIGSLEHERCDSVQAHAVFAEAARLIQINSIAFNTCEAPQSSQAALRPLLEVSNMLASAHCAPEA